MTVGELVKDLSDLPVETPVAVQVDDRHSLLDALVLHGGKQGFRITMRGLPTEVTEETVQVIVSQSEARVHGALTSKSEVKAAAPSPSRRRERIILLDTDKHTKIGETDVPVEAPGVLPEAVEVAGAAFIHHTGREYRLARQVRVPAEKHRARAH